MPTVSCKSLLKNSILLVGTTSRMIGSSCVRLGANWCMCAGSHLVDHWPLCRHRQDPLLLPHSPIPYTSGFVSVPLIFPQSLANRAHLFLRTALHCLHHFTKQAHPFLSTALYHFWTSMNPRRPFHSTALHQLHS